MCSGCGSENISCAVPSWSTNVTCVPRGTVMFCGQTAPLLIVIVVEVDDAVQPPPPDDEVGLLELPHATAKAATAAASAADIRILLLTSRLQSVLGKVIR